MGWNRGEAHLAACFIVQISFFLPPFSISGIYAGERMSNPFIACGSQHNVMDVAQLEIQKHIWMIKGTKDFWMRSISCRKGVNDKNELNWEGCFVILLVSFRQCRGKLSFLRLDSIGVFFSLKVEPKCLLCHNLKESEPLPSTQYK